MLTDKDMMKIAIADLLKLEKKMFNLGRNNQLLRETAVEIMGEISDIKSHLTICLSEEEYKEALSLLGEDFDVYE